ncbi:MULTISPECIES: nucleotidyltransferase family protein [unclassified Thioalkalivibrio]|uniref:nucleotidyltransferase family protein n=1 Tax=unclassified Thioalkalivibrio TaxID=2621013 RepID=UPI000476C051|nr:MULTISPECIES: nucleotidyltransferase family protein [unclassified Thioalkalivibrio]
MRPSVALRHHRAAVQQIVERHHARNARVFGSVLRGDDKPGSDLDLLVDPTEETSLLDIGAIRGELTELLGVEVDVVTPGALPEKWRSQVLETARAI